MSEMPNTVLHTDKAASYNVVAREVASHHTVDHKGGEYVRGAVSTNKCENFFSQLKAQHRRHPPPRFDRSPAPLPGRVRLPQLHPQDERRCPHGAHDEPDRRTSAHLPSSGRLANEDQVDVV